MKQDKLEMLRERTGASLADCRLALADTGGHMGRSVALLRERGLATRTHPGALLECIVVTVDEIDDLREKDQRAIAGGMYDWSGLEADLDRLREELVAIGPPAIPTLLEALDDRRESMVAAAARALADLEYFDSDLRARVVEALGRSVRDARRSRLALESLARLDSDAALAALSQMSGPADAALKMCIAGALGPDGSLAPFRDDLRACALVEALRRETDPIVKSYVASILG